MAVLNRENINRPALPAEAVEVPEWNGEVVVRALTLSERNLLGTVKDGQFQRHVLHKCVTGDDKAPIFTEDEWDAQGALDSGICNRLFEKALRLSGMWAEDPKVQEAQSESSSASLPAPSAEPSAS